jgi:hypothetical protein
MANPNLTETSASKLFFTAFDLQTTAIEIVKNVASSNQLFLVESIRVKNQSTTNNRKTTIFVRRSSQDFNIAKNVLVEQRSTIEIITSQTPVYLLEGDSIYASAEVSNLLEVLVSYKVLSTGSVDHNRDIVFLSVPTSAHVNSTLTVNLITSNVSNGTSYSYSISGVTSADLNGAALSGNITVNSGVASIAFLIQSSANGKTMTFSLPSLGQSTNTSISASAVINGGTESTYTSGGLTFKQHVFTSTASVNVSVGGPVQVLVVGGGGGGGVLGGGGGGGAVVVASGTVSPGLYTATVGAGGQPQFGWSTTPGSIATKGTQSDVFGIIAFGGGGARSYSNGGAITENQNVANYGGLGQGMLSYPVQSASFATNVIPSGWTGTISAGFVGGFGSSGCCPCTGGGGGGAGAPGANAPSADGATAANGGDGVIPTLSGVPMYNGQNFWFGGGGAADAYTCAAKTAGTPGKGGGGGGGSSATQFSVGDSNGINPGGNGANNGGLGGTNGFGGSGGANTGGGAGAGSNGSGVTTVRGGFGGTGIVVIRYQI